MKNETSPSGPVERRVICAAPQPPRCPKCGYTKRDCRELMDHHVCGEPDPAPACITCHDRGWVGGPSYYQPDEGGEPCPDCSAPMTDNVVNSADPQGSAGMQS